MQNVFYNLGGAIVGATVLSSTIACGQTTQNGHHKDEFIMGNAWYTGAAEMLGMAQTEYNAAKMMFQKLTTTQSNVWDLQRVDPQTFHVTNPTSQKAIPAVLIDIDETVLSNIAYQNYNLLTNQNYGFASWTKWIKARQAVAIAGALDFIKFVWTHGGVVIFDSNRDQAVHKKATQDNLIDQGLSASFVPDWAFWMQHVDLTSGKPWQAITTLKSSKEDRINSLNRRKAGYDLSPETDDNNVVFKTVMRIGDNLDDFNDNASYHKLNAERRKIVRQLAANFGSTTSPGKIYDKVQKTFEDEAWNEGYVLIGGNVSYGGWESGIAAHYFSLHDQALYQARLKALHALPVWNGTATWDGQVDYGA